MSTEINELSLDEIEAVSGGDPTSGQAPGLNIWDWWPWRVPRYDPEPEVGENAW